ncbi:MAG TPA: sugar phosphate nucleotidyltransferase, partial [Nitrosopumilaceae archaeon]|nr:sugar phosphate nucleotidyltransferase [Nitrosopumilaceae archaeon]
QEKPKKPKSRHAIIAIYIFKPTIFQYLSNPKRKTDPEKQLAEAFNIAIRKGSRVIGVVLKKNERRIDIGTPESYSKVLGSLK